MTQQPVESESEAAEMCPYFLDVPCYKGKAKSQSSQSPVVLHAVNTEEGDRDKVHAMRMDGEHWTKVCCRMAHLMVCL